MLDKVQQPPSKFNTKQRRALVAFVYGYFTQVERVVGFDPVSQIIMGAVASGPELGIQPCIAWVASYTGIPQQTVSRRVSDLSKDKWLIETKGPGRRIFLRVNLDRAKDVVPFIDAQVQLLLDTAKEIDLHTGSAAGSAPI